MENVDSLVLNLVIDLQDEKLFRSLFRMAKDAEERQRNT